MQRGWNSRQRANPSRLLPEIKLGIPLPKVTPASALFPPKITRTSSHEPHGVFIFHFLFKGEALIPAEGIFFAKSPVVGRRVAITEGGSGEGTDQLQVKKGLNFLKVL